MTTTTDEPHYVDLDPVEVAGKPYGSQELIAVSVAQRYYRCCDDPAYIITFADGTHVETGLNADQRNHQWQLSFGWSVHPHQRLRFKGTSSQRDQLGVYFDHPRLAYNPDGPVVDRPTAHLISRAVIAERFGIVLPLDTPPAKVTS